MRRTSCGDLSGYVPKNCPRKGAIMRKILIAVASIAVASAALAPAAAADSIQV